MLTRIIAALSLIPLLIVIVIGGLPLYLAEFLRVAMALHEFYKAFKEKEINPLFNIGYIFAGYLALKNIFNLDIEYTYVIVFVLFLC